MRIVALLLLFHAALPCAAQEGSGKADPPEEAAKKQRVEETIVVTATRSERAVSDLPVSTTVINDGSIRPEAMQPFLAWARKNGYLEADVPVSTWWNRSFIDAAR